MNQKRKSRPNGPPSTSSAAADTTATNPTTTNPTTAYYVVLHRGDSGRWHRLGVADSLREALALITGGGDFWLRERRDDEPEPEDCDEQP